jgi:hypothetical protein
VLQRHAGIGMREGRSGKAEARCLEVPHAECTIDCDDVIEESSSSCVSERLASQRPGQYRARRCLRRRISSRFVAVLSI